MDLAIVSVVAVVATWSIQDCDGAWPGEYSMLAHIARILCGVEALSYLRPHGAHNGQTPYEAFRRMINLATVSHYLDNTTTEGTKKINNKL